MKARIFAHTRVVNMGTVDRILWPTEGDYDSDKLVNMSSSRLKSSSIVCTEEVGMGSGEVDFFMSFVVSMHIIHISGQGKGN